MSKAEVEKQYSIANSYITKGNKQYAEARAILEKILPFAEDSIRRRILPKLPLTWYLEGGQYENSQKYAQALICMEKARKGFHENGLTKNEINALCQIGTIKFYQYDTKGAMDAYQRACSLAASIKYDTKLMSIFGELRTLNERVGDNEQVWVFTRRMDSLAACIAGDSVRFDYYRHCGDEVLKQGDFALAEQWYRKNDSYITRLNDAYSGAHKNLYYSDMTKLYAQKKQWKEAIRYAMLRKDDIQRRYEKTNPNHFYPYMDIADIYKKMGDSIMCFHQLDTLFVLLDLLDEPREKKDLYVTRGLCHLAFNNYEQALTDFKAADSLLATLYDQDDADRITLLPIMGGTEHQLGHFDTSEQLYRTYAEKIKDLLGENDSQYIEALVYLANAEGFAGHIETACNDYTTAIGKLKQQIREKMPYLTTAERNGYWKQVSQLIQRMTPFALEAKKHQTSFSSSCYDGLVLSKAFLLETERSTFELIKKEGTEEDLKNFSVIVAIQSRVRELEKDRDEYADSILELTTRMKQLEAQLALKCKSYGDMTAFMGIGYDTIKSRLNDGDVLIDFTDFVSETRGRVYAAYLVDNKQENPLLQKLFAESKIDSMQVAYPDQYYESPYAESLYQLLWMPFKDKVTEGVTVYYVPSQLLFQIALESLPLEDGTLLGEHYHFVRLSSARELVNLDKRLDIDMASANTVAVLYGGLVYDLEATDWELEAKKYDVSSLLAVHRDILQGDSIPLLPGSKKEVDAIEQIMKSYQLKVESYTGKRGTEESFMNMSGKAPQILHVATHGFYYTPDEAQEINYLRGYEDAMSLSGLIMAGGNAAWRGKELPEGVLGGILTASNIARLDLSNTKLTVLSACQSGKGKATSEGLYGLQRAFKKAGVKTMIMSLWNVSDVVGTEFMNIFYENLLDTANHFDKQKAFEKAKSTIREKYPEPYYWACFVMLD